MRFAIEETMEHTQEKKGRKLIKSAAQRAGLKSSPVYFYSRRVIVSLAKKEKRPENDSISFE